VCAGAGEPAPALVSVCLRGLGENDFFLDYLNGPVTH
jgi:hypothetical protein